MERNHSEEEKKYLSQRNYSALSSWLETDDSEVSFSIEISSIQGPILINSKP